MLSSVKNKVRAYLRAFELKDPATQQAEVDSAAGRLTLYEINAHGMTSLYQQAGLIYLRLLRKMASKKIEHSERAHALLSASSASRWMACTPSPRLEEGFEEKESDFAAEGTLAHEFAELMLRRQLGLIDTRAFFAAERTLKKSKHYQDEMLDFVQLHVDYVLQQYTEAKRLDKHAVILIEERVDITHLIEEGFGTCDVIIISGGLLEVVDLKYGLGVRVKAEDNSQLKLYGSGALEKYDIKYDIHTVRLTITQPRMDSISSWEIDAEALTAWGQDEVIPKALEAYAGEGDQVTGDHCRFCKASPKCKAQEKLALEAMQNAFDDPKLMTDEELVSIYGKIGQVTKWFSSVADHLYSEAMNGKKWEGLKLVDGQNRRGWVDEQKAQEKLEGEYKLEDFTNTKLKGIGDIEKLVGKKNFPIMFLDLVENKKTSPSLVPESDKRPEMKEVDYFEDDDEI